MEPRTANRRGDGAASERGLQSAGSEVLGGFCGVNAALHKRSAPRVAAHSLIEFVGVMAVLAILAAALLPLFVRSVDKTVLAKEVGEMNTISNALVMQIIRSSSVPNQGSWASAAASWAMRGTSQVQTNSRGFPRLYFYDNGGWMTNATYTQDINGAGSIQPASGRIVIVSTIANALPYANGALSTANFNSIWSAAPHTTPAYLTTQGWTGKADDLVIQRISLGPLFHHLILTTRDTSGNAQYSVKGDSTVGVVPTTGQGWDTYYLHNTAVSLWAGSTRTNTFILTADTGFTWDQGMWQVAPSSAGTDNSSLATNYVAQAATFLGDSIPPGAKNGPSAQGVVAGFCTFMYAYTIWANECPYHFYTTASSQIQATDYQLLDWLAKNNGIIDTAAGKTGLLK